MAWEARLGLKPVILALLFTILVVEIVGKACSGLKRLSATQREDEWLHRRSGL